MKKLIFCLLLSLTVISVSAQEKGKFRIGGNLGMTIPPYGFGGTIDLLDVRYNFLDNFNVGVKFGGAFMVRDFMQINETMGAATMHMNTNFMFVGDYYFNNGVNSFAPFVGAGYGSFRIIDVYMQVRSGEQYNYQYDDFPETRAVAGGVIRTGFEWGKFRMALEYYILPQTLKYDAADIMRSAGSSENSYISLNLGFYFGGGRWVKR